MLGAVSRGNHDVLTMASQKRRYDKKIVQFGVAQPRLLHLQAIMSSCVASKKDKNAEQIIAKSYHIQCHHIIGSI